MPEEKQGTTALGHALRDILNGSIAGACGKIIEYPFDTIKVRLQTQGRAVFPTTLSCIKYTYMNEGIFRGFFQGIASPIMGAAMENAALFVSYNQSLKILDKHTSITPLQQILVAAAVAGSCASVVLTPVELVKCQLQVSNLKALQYGTIGHTSIISTVKHVLLTKGFSGLWQGQSGTFLRESIGGVAWFATYEITKDYFQRSNKSKGEPVDTKPWQLLTSGACAGLAFNASIFPCDTIKSVMQTQHISLSRAFREIIGKHGIPGFYRGLEITLIRAIPANATVFYLYETLTKALE